MQHFGYNPMMIHSAVNTKAYNWMLKNLPINKVNVTDAATSFKVYTLDWYYDKLETFVGDEDDPLNITRIFMWPKLQRNWTEWYVLFIFFEIKFLTFSSRPFDQPFYLLLATIVGGDKW